MGQLAEWEALLGFSSWCAPSKWGCTCLMRKHSSYHCWVLEEMQKLPSHHLVCLCVGNNTRWYAFYPEYLEGRRLRHLTFILGFPGGSDGEEFACSAGDPGSIPRSGRSPGEGHGNLLQYSCLGTSVDGGAWQAAVHGVVKSWKHLSDWALSLKGWGCADGNNNCLSLA